MIEFLVNHVKNESDYELLSRLLNTTWNQETDADIIRQRIESGNTFVVAYDIATEKDVKVLKERYGLDYDINDVIPIGFLESIALNYEKPEDIGQQSYEDLTQEDKRWKTPSKDAKTLLLVDLTFIDSRFGEDIYPLISQEKKENVKYINLLAPWIRLRESEHEKTPIKKGPYFVTASDLMIEYAIDLARKQGFKHLWTYTPWAEDYLLGINVHLRHYAKLTKHAVNNAREWFLVKVAKITDYTCRF